MIEELNKRYNELFPTFFEVLLKHKEEPKNLDIYNLMKYYELNLNYIEKYMQIVKTNNKEKIEKQIEIIDFEKTCNDTIYKPKNKEQEIKNPKIQEIS
jgi:hypothetical protein